MIAATPESCRAHAREALRRCRELAACSEAPDVTTRTFLSAPMRDVHERVSRWMRQAGMAVRIDAAGNIRGVYDADPARRGRAAASDTRRLFIGSHLDTVPNAGAFDGVLGVMLAIALIEGLAGRRYPFAIEAIGFSEEEGVRFGMPFIGSLALAGSLGATHLARTDAAGARVDDAIRTYGLDPATLDDARAPAGSLGYLEFHIEQGPVLDNQNAPLAAVDAIVGQSRLEVTFAGAANHAGTTPMDARRDAVTGAAEWIVAVEADALATAGLVATVGRVDAVPGAVNVIAGRCRATLDVRHADDDTRHAAVDRFTARAGEIAARRSLAATFETRLDQPAVPMDPHLTALLERSIAAAGMPVRRISSGAGHDAMVVAACMPAAMLFVRSPRGISHHPDEAVHEEDAAAALAAGALFLDALAESSGG